MISIATSVLITNAEGVLLVHEIKVDKYGLPGGKLEQGETLRDGAIRECKEETGWTPIIDRLIFVSQKPMSREGNNVVRYIYQAHIENDAQKDDSAELESTYISQDRWLELKHAEAIRGKDVVAVIDAFYRGELTALPEPIVFT